MTVGCCCSWHHNHLETHVARNKPFLELPCASVSTRVFAQNLSYENKFYLHENELAGGNTFSYESFRMETRFDTEAKGNSKMANWKSGF